MSEENNLLGSFSPTAGLLQVGSQIGSIYQGNHHDFAPRIGLAWDLSGRKTTVLRAGYNILYSSLIPMQAFTGIAGGQNGSTGGVATIPTGAVFVVNGVSKTGHRQHDCGRESLRFPAGVGSPLALNWQNNGPNQPIFFRSEYGRVRRRQQRRCGQCDFSVQHLVRGPASRRSLRAELEHRRPARVHAYAYARRFLRRQPWLRAPWTSGHQSRDSHSRQRECHSRSLRRAVPIFRFHLQRNAKSLYIELQCLLQTHRDPEDGAAGFLSSPAGYTYSHSLDDDSGSIVVQYLPQDSRNPLAEYASSDFDIRHRFTFSATYKLPGRKSVGQLLEGWEVNSVLTLQTGQPWYGNDTVDNISGTNEFADRWDFVGNPHDFMSGNSSIPVLLRRRFQPVPGTNITCTAS